jgi:predicted alpha/beta-fold hydrolase
VLRERLLDPRPTARHGRVVAARFAPPFWLAHRHLQTILPNALRRRPRDLPLVRERVELPDGDFVDVDWLGSAGAPIVVVLHGLEGSIESPYAASLLRSLSHAGFRGALLHFRGCSGEPNRLPRAYHSGDTAHLEHFLGLLEAREPGVPRAAVGYSLGGNALLKWLGESGDATRLATAIAVSVPFDLERCAAAMDRGFSRVYQKQLIDRMQRNARVKARVVPGFPTYPDHEVSSFRRFDDKLTAPLHGFADAADYYARCSSRRFLRGIRTPTLILHAADDPFMDPSVVPTAAELAPAVTLELAARGGHVGFIAGPWWRPHRWVDRRVVAHLRERLGWTEPPSA